MTNIWTIKDSEGNVTNAGIKADEAFMEANFEYYEAFVAPDGPEISDVELAREWRDGELTRTDTLHLLDDHPQKSAYTTYRAALRDWPSTSDFPATKPTL